MKNNDAFVIEKELIQTQKLFKRTTENWKVMVWVNQEAPPPTELDKCFKRKILECTFFNYLEKGKINEKKSFHVCNCTGKFRPVMVKLFSL